MSFAQEFRYVTPGALFVAFVALGAYLIDPRLALAVGAVGGLSSVAVGWVAYQWLAYLTYRSGGVQCYPEIAELRSRISREGEGTLIIPFRGDQVQVGVRELTRILEELGEDYYGELAPHYVRPDGESHPYLSALHDALFIAEAHHDYARSLYGIHHTLSMIYWVTAWGMLFVSVGLGLGKITAGPWQAAYLLACGAVVCGLTLLVTRCSAGHLQLPRDYFALLAAIYTLPAIGSVALLKGAPTTASILYACALLVFLLYLLAKSTIPCRMVRVEAGIHERFLTWVYWKWLARPDA